MVRAALLPASLRVSHQVSLPASCRAARRAAPLAGLRAQPRVLVLPALLLLPASVQTALAAVRRAVDPRDPRAVRPTHPMAGLPREPPAEQAIVPTQEVAEPVACLATADRASAIDGCGHAATRVENLYLVLETLPPTPFAFLRMRAPADARIRAAWSISSIPWRAVNTKLIRGRPSPGSRCRMDRTPCRVRAA